jgi:hypothetical protein
VSTSFSFPADPTLNQIVPLPDGGAAQWNGYAWVSVEDNVTYPLEIPKGGTGATNPASARINLGLNTATGEFIVQKDGTAAAPGIAFASEPGLGWYRAAAGQIAVAAGGAQVSMLDASAAAYTDLQLYSRAAGSAALTLLNAPNAAANWNAVQLVAGVAGSPHKLTGLTKGAAVAQGLQMVFPTVQFSDGTVAAPAISFFNEAGLGWYRQAASVIGAASQGARVAALTAASATNTGLYLNPRAHGSSVLQLSNDVVSAADYNTISMFTQSGALGSVIQLTKVGAATLGPLTIISPAAVYVSHNFFALNTSAAQMGFTYDGANGNYLHMLGGGANWRWQADRTLGRLTWQRNGTSPNTVFSESGDLLTGRDLWVGTDGTFGLVTSSSGSGVRYLRWSIDGWRLEYQTTTGAMRYVNAGSTSLFSFNPDGEFQARGGVHSFSGNGDGPSMWYDGGNANYLGMQGRNAAWSWQFNRANGTLVWLDYASVINIVIDGVGWASKRSGPGDWLGTSDIRLKRDVRPFEYGLNAILAFDPIWYRYKDDKDDARMKVAFAADEARKVIPEMVWEGSDGYLLMDTTPLKFALINAVKTINERLTALECQS